MRCIALVGLLVSGFAVAQQASETVLGMELRAPLSIPECGVEGMFKAPKAPESGACYVRDTVRDAKGHFAAPTGPLANDGMEIRFAFNSRPSIAAGKVRASLREGNLASVVVFTGGMGSQENDLKLLTEKYGQPIRITRPSYQNAYGARFEGMQAEWELPSGTFVRLESPDMTLMKLPNLGGNNIGTLRVMTAEVRAESDARSKLTDDQRTKL
jgi:hypothetical protein